MRPPRGDEARPLDRTSHTLFEDPSSLMRRDLSLGMPIPSRQLRGIGIPRDIAAAKAQACEKFGLDSTSHTLYEDPYRLMRRDLSLGMPIPSRQLRGIGIPRYIAAAKAQGLRMNSKTEDSSSCFSRRFMEARRFSSSEEVGVA